ncbi:hypothetical protein BJ741DRAFT_57950 [Chytriomyces cf. hyalinus JEL632]|nr:hypothetical protein BJ741DRAFT_57950 [Chytriomyces cf. hyalinus JEL632]
MSLTAAQLLSSSALAGSFFLFGDIATQYIHNIPSPAAKSDRPSLEVALSNWDSERTAKMAAFGFGINGWYFLSAFQILDKVIGPAKTLRLATIKAVANQIIFVPPYSAGFLYYSAAYVHTKSIPGAAVNAWDSMVQKFPTVFAMGCLIWPAVNVISFRFVSPGLPRVALMNTVGLCWTTYLASVAASSEIGSGTKSSGLDEEAYL